MTRIVPLACVVVLMTSCAAIPDIEYSYFLSKLDAVASVTQTVTCNSDKKITVVNTPSLIATYSADLDRGPFKVDIKSIEGTFGGFADSDVSFGFTDDGRLKSVNQSTTGQGDTVIKSIVSTSTTIAGPFRFVLVKQDGTKKTPCDVVADWASDKTKPNVVGLSYSAELYFPPLLRQTTPIEIKPTDASVGAYKALVAAGTKLPTFVVDTGPFSVKSRAIDLSGKDLAPGGQTVHLTLQKIAIVEFQIRQTDTPKSKDRKVIWKGNVPVPTGDTFDLPIPTAALFGSQKLILQLSDAGQISSVEYGKNTGAAGASNAAGYIATALTPESTTSKAADLKAQADLIAQQQRLNRCQANPLTCQ